MKNKYRKDKSQINKKKTLSNLQGVERLLMDIIKTPLQEENLLEEPIREERILALIRKKQKALQKGKKTMPLEADGNWGPGPPYSVPFWIEVKQKGDQTLIISCPENKEQILKESSTVRIPQTGQVELRQSGSRWNLSFSLVGVYKKKSTMAIKILKDGDSFGHRSLKDGQLQMEDVPSGKYIFILTWKGVPLSCFGMEL